MKQQYIQIGLLSILAIGLLGGCTTVEPWDRNILAQPSMTVIPDPLWANWNQHAHASREGTEGASGIGGGGCGCS